MTPRTLLGRIAASLGRPATPLVALMALLGWDALVDAPPVPYVLYRTDRYPLIAAGGFKACHDLAWPEVRCFDTMFQMREDVASRFPQRVAGLDKLLQPVRDDLEDSGGFRVRRR